MLAYHGHHRMTYAPHSLRPSYSQHQHEDVHELSEPQVRHIGRQNVRLQ